MNTHYDENSWSKIHDNDDVFSLKYLMRFVKKILLQDFVTYEPLKNAFLSDGDESQLFNYDAEQLNDGEE